MANRGARPMNAGARERLVNQESGLLGVSIASHDMRDLLESALSDEAAAMRSSSTAISRANNLAHLLPCLAGLRRIVALRRAGIARYINQRFNPALTTQSSVARPTRMRISKIRLPVATGSGQTLRRKRAAHGESGWQLR